MTGPDNAVLTELESWLNWPDRAEFPYDLVVDAFHRVGKHFVAGPVLELLDKARSVLSGIPSDRLLGRFLDVVLDKYDGRYDYTTYLALALLPMPIPDEDDLATAGHRHDRLVSQLVCDVMSFELAAADGGTSLLPDQRPDAHTSAKRLRLAVSALAPASRRLGLPVTGTADPPDAVRELCAAVRADRTPDEHRALRLSLLPVDVVHDEYLFIRVLQSFETSFALLAVHLRAAVDGVTEGDGRGAARLTRGAARTLGEAAPLFALLATMRVESFRTFRAHTEGASAIQSRNYKLVESLCRTPDRARVHSAAYRSVPEVRRRVLSGQSTLDEVVSAASASGTIGATELAELTQAMESFAAALRRWRQTHYRLAVRMLGQRPGTGYTQGTPYLSGVRTIPVFRSVGDDGPS